MWLLIMSWISLGIFVITLILLSIDSFKTSSLSIGEVIALSFSCATVFFVFLGMIPAVVGSMGGVNRVDPSTATYTIGTAEDLIGSKQTFRDCAPGDAKFTLVSGKENDVSFWVGGPPPDYREVLICK